MAEQTDDQRAAEPDLLEAERILREDAEHPLSAAVLAELARLRAELAETRAERDGAMSMAAAVVRATYSDTMPDEDADRVRGIVAGWRADAERRRSVRGDAPAPAVKAGKYNGVRYWDGPGWEVEERGGRVHLGSTPADARIELTPEILTAIEAATAAARGDAPAPAEPPADDSLRADVRRWAERLNNTPEAYQDSGVDLVAEIVSEMYHALGEGTLDGEEPAAPAAALAEPPAVELPVTLSSPDDVAAVCLAHGLTEQDLAATKDSRTWTDAHGTVRVRAWFDDDAFYCCALVDAPFGVDMHVGTPSSVLVAAIEAARGGAR